MHVAGGISAPATASRTFPPISIFWFILVTLPSCQRSPLSSNFRCGVSWRCERPERLAVRRGFIDRDGS